MSVQLLEKLNNKLVIANDEISEINTKLEKAKAKKTKIEGAISLIQNNPDIAKFVDILTER